MKIDLTEIDKQILAKHDPGVRARAMFELLVVDTLIQAAQDNLYHLNIEGEDEEQSTFRDADKFKAALFDLDDAVVLVFTGKGRKAFGWIRLVFGNSGYDLISDYSTSLESFLKPVDKVAKFWGD